MGSGIKLIWNDQASITCLLTEKALHMFQYTFLPTVPEILRQYKAYLKFVQYFGYFSEKNSYHHPNLDLIINASVISEIL
jgi:hypothetical protein